MHNRLTLEHHQGGTCYGSRRLMTSTVRQHRACPEHALAGSSWMLYDAARPRRLYLGQFQGINLGHLRQLYDKPLVCFALVLAEGVTVVVKNSSSFLRFLVGCNELGTIAS